MDETCRVSQLDFVNINFVLQIVYLREILVIIVTREDFLLGRYECSTCASLPLHGSILTRALASTNFPRSSCP